MLDTSATRAPSVRRARFRDIDTSATSPPRISSFRHDPLPDIRTQAAMLRRNLTAGNAVAAASQRPRRRAADIEPPSALHTPRQSGEAFVIDENGCVTPHTKQERFHFTPGRTPPPHRMRAKSNA